MRKFLILSLCLVYLLLGQIADAMSPSTQNNLRYISELYHGNKVVQAINFCTMYIGCPHVPNTEKVHFLIQRSRMSKDSEKRDLDLVKSLMEIEPVCDLEIQKYYLDIWQNLKTLL